MNPWNVCVSMGVLAFLSLILSSRAAQYIDDSLQAKMYAGKPVSEGIENYQRDRIEINGDAVPQLGTAYTQLPVLIGFDKERIKIYTFSFGLLEHFRSGEVEGFDDERIAFSDESIGLLPALKVEQKKALSYSSRASDATGYYLQAGNVSTGCLLFQFAPIMKAKDTPYYQEITQRAHPTPNILPNQKGNQPLIKGEHITFYHLDRNDGYIETYGFRQPKGNELKGVEQILVLQAIYPAAQMAELAGPLRELFVQEVQQHQAVWGY